MSVGLASCQQENTVKPATLADEPHSNLRDEISAGRKKNYQLIKDGAVSLSYYDDGRLKKVIYAPGTRGGGGPTYVQYKYGNHWIVGTLYYDNKVAQVMTYSLDANGNCYESKQVDYIPYGPNAVLEQESGFTYLYNQKGQLATRTNKKFINRKTLFAYDAAGDLTKISDYNPSPSNPGLGLVSEHTLYYDQPTGDPLLDNLSPINPDVANLPDPYLMIFGKSSKHLIKMITQKGSLGGKYYNYEVDKEGYATKRQEYEISGAALIESKSYEYLITEIGFNL